MPNQTLAAAAAAAAAAVLELGPMLQTVQSQAAHYPAADANAALAQHWDHKAVALLAAGHAHSRSVDAVQQGSWAAPLASAASRHALGALH